MRLRRHVPDKTPLVVIFSESGPLGGDLAAVLTGRFELIRCTNLNGALAALDKHPAALVVLGDGADDPDPRLGELYLRALAAGCRILALGNVPLCVVPEERDRIRQYDQMPGPARILESLGNLTAAAES